MHEGRAYHPPFSFVRRLHIPTGLKWIQVCRRLTDTRLAVLRIEAFMKIGPRTRIALTLIAAVALVGWALWQQYWYYLPGIMQALRDPVGENQVVDWKAATNAPRADGNPPNIVLIVADDLGYNDISLNGGGVAGGIVKTPHIDSIARNGIDFQRSYAGNATCAPSRAAMMTGRFATRFGFEFTPTGLQHAKVIGVADNASPWPTIFHAEHEATYPATGNMQVPTTEVMLPERLRERGYRTLGVGKWHLGDSPTSRPEARGFDAFLGFNSATTLYLPKNDPQAVNAENPAYPPDKFLWANLAYGVKFNGGSRFAPKGYVTDYFAEEAARSIAANRNQPFFLYVGFSAPHLPLQALKSDYESLSEIKDHRLRVYGAMIKSLDRGVGTILEALKSNGLSDNTIVIFTSDNGGAGAAGLADLNAPLRGWKSTFYDGGIRVPMFVQWPARLKPAVVTTPVGHVDIFATAVTAAGIEPKTDKPIDGLDLAAIAAGTISPSRVLFWRSGGYSAILKGDWKLQRVTRPAPADMLYDLSADPGERQNLAATATDRLAELQADLEAMQAASAPTLWPSLIEAPVPLDGPIDGTYETTDAYVYWSN
jgi:arylsulfatase A-like enzyme